MTLTQIRPVWRVIFTVLALAAAIGKHQFGGLFGKIFATVATVFLAVKIVRGVGAASKRLCAAWHRSLRGIPLWKEVLPPWFRGLASTEALIYCEVFFRLLRVKSPSQKLHGLLPIGRIYTLSKGDFSTILIPLAVIGMFADVPLSHVIVNIWVSSHALWIHVGLLFLTVCGFIWIVGDRFAVRELAHVVSGETLSLHVGFRWSGELSIHAVTRCIPLNCSLKEWRKSNGFDQNAIWIVTPIDSPNVLVETAHDAASDVRIARMGVDVPPRKFIALYVDNPKAFISDIRTTSESIRSKK